MMHKDKQDKWFSNYTANGKTMRIIDEPKTLADWHRLVDEHVKPLIKTESILSEAERIVNGERQADYSDPVENFKHISAIASAIMARTSRQKNVAS